MKHTSMDHVTDSDLIKQAQKGDAKAFARLVERHYMVIYKIAFKWCGNQADAEDIAQEVSIKLVDVLKSFKAQAAFSSWLYRITLNAVRDMQRRRKRRSEHIADMSLIVQRDCPPTQEVEAEQSDLWQAVHSLPAKQRDAVLLVFSEEQTHAEAAEIMGCAETTVSWHIHKAKQKLKALLEGDFLEEGPHKG